MKDGMSTQCVPGACLSKLSCPGHPWPSYRFIVGVGRGSTSIQFCRQIGRSPASNHAGDSDASGSVRQGQGVQKLSLHRQRQSALSQWSSILNPWLAVISAATADTLHPRQAGEAMLVLPLVGNKGQA